MACYRNVLKQKGEPVYDFPATHEFDVGKYHEETMAFPAGRFDNQELPVGGVGGLSQPETGRPAAAVQVDPSVRARCREMRGTNAVVGPRARHRRDCVRSPSLMFIPAEHILPVRRLADKASGCLGRPAVIPSTRFSLVTGVFSPFLTRSRSFWDCSSLNCPASGRVFESPPS